VANFYNARAIVIMFIFASERDIVCAKQYNNNRFMAIVQVNLH